MTESERKEIEKFSAELPELRKQVSDGGLLDRCQAYLAALLELSKDDALEPDPEPPAAEEKTAQ